MQHVHVERPFAVPADRAFAWVSEHENIGPLFLSRITRLSDGEDGRRNGVGSRRSMRVWPLPAFEEYVTEVVPGELIRYRMAPGGPLRDHRGEIRFFPEGDGSRIEWDIWFRSGYPGSGPLMAALLPLTMDRGLRAVNREA